MDRIKMMRCFYASLKKMGGGMSAEELKCSMVGGVSKGRTVHVSELSDDELCCLVRAVSREAESDRDKELKRYRRMVLLLMTEYGIDTLDWERVNAFTEQRRICGKAFYDMGVDELKLVGKKLRIILKQKNDKEK